MKWTEVEKKYGKEMAKKMLEKLEGCTIGVEEDGTENYYDHDVEWAFKMVTGKIKPRWEWD